MEELETLSRIRITHQVLGGRLFADENEAVSHIVDAAYKSLLEKCLMKGASHEIQWTISYVADAILIAEPSPSEFEDLIGECGGSPDLSDLSDECSETFTSLQNYQRYGHVKRPCTYVVKPTESPLEDSPDLSSSIPAVQVTEASDDFVVNNKDVETPACPDDEWTQLLLKFHNVLCFRFQILPVL
ncbi:hypothetical protein SRHO_G00225200 [Serrasalmus rhombeus]